MNNPSISALKKITAVLLVISTNSFANPTNNTVHSCNAPVSIPDEGVTIKLRQGRKHRYLDVNVNGVTAQAVVDTGGIIFPLKINGQKVKAALDTGSPFTLSLPQGELASTDSEVRISDIHAFKQLFGDHPGVILGLPFFEKRQLIIDYANSTLYMATGQVLKHYNAHD